MEKEYDDEQERIEPMEETDSDTSDSDVEDSEDENDLVEKKIEINRLKLQISTEPSLTTYRCLVELLKSLPPSLTILEELRCYRKKMHEEYALPPSYWFEWLEEEMQLAERFQFTSTDLLSVVEVFEMAVGEFFSDDIYEQYILFLVSHLNDLDGFDKVRERLESIVNKSGASFSAGAKIWGYYRDFENSLLQFYISKQEVDSECEASIRSIIERIFRIFQRQLIIPMKHLEKVKQEFQTWLESINTSVAIDLRKEKVKEILDIEKHYEKAVKECETLEHFEQDLINKYDEYLDYEVKKNDLGRTQCLFERVLGILKQMQNDEASTKVWLRYLKYCDRKLVIADLLMPIYKRAVKNCPERADIWQLYLQAVERTASEEAMASVEVRTQICGIVNDSLNYIGDAYGKYNIWIGYITYLRRRLSKLGEWKNDQEVALLRQVIETSTQSFMVTDEENYYLFLIYSLWADIEAKFIGDLEAARLVWAKCLEVTQLHRNEFFWLQWAEFELRFGDDKSYHQVLTRGTKEMAESPHNLAFKLIRFEATFGDNVKDVQKCQYIYEKAMEKYMTKVAKETEIAGGSITIEEKEAGGVDRKRKFQGKMAEKPPPRKIEKKTNEVLEKKTPVVAKLGYVKTDEEKRDVTIFVSNLAFELDEEAIKIEFSQFGEVDEVRLTRNFKGLSKGFGYIVFTNNEAKRKALKADRMKISGRPVFINELDKRHQFEYSTQLEKNKLFIKNLPFEYSKDEVIEKIFSEFKEAIKDVRINMNRNGMSKGIAYVDMIDAETAKKAVEMKNDMECEGRRLFVAISDPSQSKAKPKPLAEVRTKASSTVRPASSNIMIPSQLLRTQPKTRLNVSKVSAVSNESEQPKNQSNGSSNQSSGNDVGGDNKTQTVTNLTNKQFHLFLKPSK